MNDLIKIHTYLGSMHISPKGQVFRDIFCDFWNQSKPIIEKVREHPVWSISREYSAKHENIVTILGIMTQIRVTIL